MKSSKRPSKDSPRPKRTEKPQKSGRPTRSDKPKSDARPKRTFNSDDRPKRSDSPRDNDRPKRTFNSDDRPKRTFNSDDRPKRDFNSNDRPKRDFNSDDRLKRTFNSDDRPKRTFNSNDRPKGTFNSDDRPKRTFNSDDRPKRDFNSDDRPKRTFNSDDRPKRTIETDDRPTRKVNTEDDAHPKRSEKPVREMRPRNKSAHEKATSTFKANEKGVFKPHIAKSTPADDDDTRLNKYVAMCGIAARRKAGEMILAGEIIVNGKVVNEPGLRVLPTDIIKYKGKEIKPVEQKIYILMNKPKDTITTVSDERGRKTVLDMIKRTVKERIFPVGRLDRDTTGLLLLTNDGDLAQKMAHPSYLIKKLYHVVLDKPLTKSDLDGIAKGIELEDGLAQVDGVQYVSGATKHEVMIEIHIGKNRIVRRIFEHLGYQVTRLDRVFYGGLTKKDLPRAGYRTLTEREVIMLKHFTGK